MEVFLDHIKLLLLSLGVRVFDIVEMQKAEANYQKQINSFLRLAGLSQQVMMFQMDFWLKKIPQQ